MKLFQPDIVYIEHTVRDLETTAAIVDRLAGIEVREIDSFQSMGLDHLPLNPRFKQEKQGLILAQKKGELVKEVQRDLFREIPNEYYIIHSFGCPSDCQYCFLYDYLPHQMPTLFVNVDDMLHSIEETINSRSQEKLIFHAGEFSDALAYDHITHLSQPLVELFAKYDHATLEMRTKSNNVSNLLGVRHNGKSVISWTFSPQRVVQLFEYQTATADERIEAARQCQEHGYPVALRLDPIVRYPGWERGYRALINKMAQRLQPELISDCHLGVFRYTPGLWRVIRDRFPNSWLRMQESVPSSDGKYRYFKPLRLEMYRRIIGWLREAFPELHIELCMESPEVEEYLSESLS